MNNIIIKLFIDSLKTFNKLNQQLSFSFLYRQEKKRKPSEKINDKYMKGFIYVSVSLYIY